ncbi:universal stress protein [Haloarcula sp. S1CR25-12]|uniref:Universal stress protein n=1 Tax=Haloarcula saliterrae TaxID=2950534 RepID=A0ABU2F867_9EURY|nr:universal stress protein [Haloarcula sp. S1CR25-12]MDS0258382.1 universal stress protein [Haloarcula sp. S1CR25-12]
MTILVAVADDEASSRVLETAVTLGEGLATPLYVVHLVDDADADRAAERMRDALSDRLADEPVEATVALEYVGRHSRRPGARIARELLEIAEDVDITHIVMGHEPKGLSGRLRSGDAAVAVVNETTVPVTVVPRLDEH